MSLVILLYIRVFREAGADFVAKTSFTHPLLCRRACDMKYELACVETTHFNQAKASGIRHSLVKRQTHLRLEFTAQKYCDK